MFASVNNPRDDHLHRSSLRNSDLVASSTIYTAATTRSGPMAAPGHLMFDIQKREREVPSLRSSIFHVHTINFPDHLCQCIRHIRLSLSHTILKHTAHTIITIIISSSSWIITRTPSRSSKRTHQKPIQNSPAMMLPASE